MRRLKKAAALCLSLLALLTMPVKASAAELREEIIDTGRAGSLTIYKYDITSSEKDGVWDRITEVRTANGYILLKEDIEVIISQTEGKAAATVDGKPVTMLEDVGSANAHAPLQVVNTKGFDLPQTGDRGVWMYGLIGVLLMAGSLTSLYLANRKKQGK